MGVIMRNLEAVEKDLAAAREALSSVEGTPSEVYSRIVGYYRSVRNWNLGKREEYGERRLYKVNESGLCAAAFSSPFTTNQETDINHYTESFQASETLLLLFVRTTCPSCSPARLAAERLGIPIHLMNADTEEGLAEAARRNVCSTPTAILLSTGGEELARAGDAETIGRMLTGAVTQTGASLQSEAIAV